MGVERRYTRRISLPGHRMIKIRPYHAAPGQYKGAAGVSPWALADVACQADSVSVFDGPFYGRTVV